MSKYKISRWRHKMETFSASLALWEGNSPVTGGFPSERPVTLSFGVFFEQTIDWWLETHRSHHDVTVMCLWFGMYICYSIIITLYLSICHTSRFYCVTLIGTTSQGWSWDHEGSSANLMSVNMLWHYMYNPHERHGVSNHWQLDSFLNYLFKPAHNIGPNASNKKKFVRDAQNISTWWRNLGLSEMTDILWTTFRRIFKENFRTLKTEKCHDV